MTTISTSVDLHDVEVEVEITDDIIAECVEQSDDPLKFFSWETRAQAEAVYQHFAIAGQPPESVRTLIYTLIGRIL
jgi:hypothetical protein